MLSAEYLDFENVFGLSATMDEMVKHKSKVKKQNPQWDPEEEYKKHLNYKANQEVQ